MDSIAATLRFVALGVHELMLFAAIGFLIGGLGDLATDLAWLGRSGWRRVTVYRRFARSDLTGLPPPATPGATAIFVPAWDEANVIAAMLRNTVSAFGSGDWRLYVGVYPNDPATRAAVASVDDSRITAVIGDEPGPTTKAHCLNSLWQRMRADEQRDGFRFKSVVLHDAEDVVHPGELCLYDRMIDRFDLVQIPVLPLIDRGSRWVAGHYIDEFVEAHAKTLPLREAIGASIPSAGVGCAFARAMLERIAHGRAGPFDADSLTEDYELGLRIAELGGRAAFVRLAEAPGGALIAVRAHFPADLTSSVRQKTRWIAGIALAAWDRLGWDGGPAERWMRYHDRRALAAAIVLLAAYVALVASLALNLAERVSRQPLLPPVGPAMQIAVIGCFVLLCWRLVLRCVLVTRHYGWREGLRAVPRTIVSNVIAMMAARRAVGLYLRMRRDGTVHWDKTVHRFPADADLG